MFSYLIAGGSGFIGKKLQTELRKLGNEVFVLTTKKNKTDEYTKYWIPSQGYIDPTLKLSNCHIINLAGAGVADKRWTETRKKELLDSRLDSIRTLHRAVEYGQIHCSHFCSASAIGFYGYHEGICTEDSPADNSFLSEVCQAWEEEALQMKHFDLPVAIARIGIVLDKQGGALKSLFAPLKYGLAAIPSDGNQVYSWISLQDIVNVLIYLSSNNTSGIFNAVAPTPCTISEIFDASTPYFNTKIRVHIPAIVLRLVLGQMSVEVLKSTTVCSGKLHKLGFEFESKTIRECLQKIYQVN